MDNTRNDHQFWEKDRLLKLRDAAARIAMNVRTLYRLIEAGKFPQPVKVGRLTLVPESDVTAFIEKLKKERRQ